MSLLNHKSLFGRWVGGSLAAGIFIHNAYATKAY